MTTTAAAEVVVATGGNHEQPIDTDNIDMHQHHHNAHHHQHHQLNLNRSQSVILPQNSGNLFNMGGHHHVVDPMAVPGTLAGEPDYEPFVAGSGAAGH